MRFLSKTLSSNISKLFDEPLSFAGETMLLSVLFVFVLLCSGLTLYHQTLRSFAVLA